MEVPTMVRYTCSLTQTRVGGWHFCEHDSYDPDQIHIMRQSFVGWQNIEPRLSNRPHSAGFARDECA
jgi:hypothetical protein